MIRAARFFALVATTFGLASLIQLTPARAEDVTASAPVAAAAAAPPAAAEQTSPAPTPAPIALSALTVGKGDAKFGALVQFWSLNDQTNANLNYRIRRAELKLSGSVATDTRWFVMIDPAKSLRTGAVVSTNDNKILQDLGLAYALTPELELTAGQFKTPTAAEGLDSSSELLMPERSYAARAFGDRREPGLMLTYKMPTWKFSVMSSNGQAPNVDDTNNEKDLHARLDVMPAKDISLGAFTTAGDSSTNRKARWGLNARAAGTSSVFRLEGIRAVDNDVWTSGGAADLGYSFNERFQTVIRWHVFESTYTATASSLGINYFIAKNNVKIQAAYALLNNMTGAPNGSYVPLQGTNGNAFILALQQAL